MLFNNLYEYVMMLCGDAAAAAADDDDDGFYIAQFSAVGQTHCALSHVILNE